MRYVELKKIEALHCWIAAENNVRSPRRRWVFIASSAVPDAASQHLNSSENKLFFMTSCALGSYGLT